MSWEDIEKLETRLIYKDEQISDLTKENEAIRESLEIERTENAELQAKGLSWERACEMAVLERDGARKAAQTYHDKLAAVEARAERLADAARDADEALSWIKFEDGVPVEWPEPAVIATRRTRLAAALLPPPEPAGGEG